MVVLLIYCRACQMSLALESCNEKTNIYTSYLGVKTHESLEQHDFKRCANLKCHVARLVPMFDWRDGLNVYWEALSVECSIVAWIYIWIYKQTYRCVCVLVCLHVCMFVQYCLFVGSGMPWHSDIFIFGVCVCLCDCVWIPDGNPIWLWPLFLTCI